MPQTLKPGEKTGSRGKALVMEDERSVRVPLTHMLESEGFTVIATDSGTVGVEKFREDPTGFSLVTSDFVMHGLFGDKAVAEIRKLNPTVPIIVIADNATDPVTKQDIPGANMFLDKPVSLQTIREAVRRLTTQKV